MNVLIATAVERSGGWPLVSSGLLCAAERPGKRKNIVRWWLARLRRLRYEKNPIERQRARINQISQCLVDEVEGA